MGTARIGASDFQVGRRFVTPRRTVTETHMVVFAGITGDSYPLHMDEQFAAQTPFGTRIVHGPLVYALSVGLAFEAGVYQESIAAFLGVEELRHLAPCFPGDTVHVVCTVVGNRPSTSKRDCAVVTIEYEVVSQEDRPLMRSLMIFLMHERSKEQEAR
jgi:acyl dehydratase